MKWRTALGAVLILTSLGLIYFWETRGRDALMLSAVLTVSRDMTAGEALLPQDVATIHVLPQNVIADALTPASRDRILGQTVVYPLKVNQQLAGDYFRKDQEVVGSNESVFPIHPQWIGSMSSAVRPGDAVRLISASTEDDMGMYRVAYVTDQAGKTLETAGRDTGDLLGRDWGSDPAAGLEIVCTPEEYLALHESQAVAAPGDLIIFMEGGL